MQRESSKQLAASQKRNNGDVLSRIGNSQRQTLSALMIRVILEDIHCPLWKREVCCLEGMGKFSPMIIYLTYSTLQKKNYCFKGC